MGNTRVIPYRESKPCFRR